MRLVHTAAAMAAVVCTGVAGLATAGTAFLLGAGTHFGQGRGDPDRLTAALADNGLQSFRDEIFWHDVERQRGDYRLPTPDAPIMRALRRAGEREIAPLLILCYGNGLYGEAYPVSEGAQEAFARYAEFLARSLRGSVRHFEVWNEWNGGLGSPQGATAKTPDHYFSLLRRAHAAVKRGNREAVVVAGAVEGGGVAALAWIDRLFALGGGKYMDALSVHPYLHHGGPDANPERLAGWFEHLDGIMRRHGVDVPVYVTEIGWPNYPGPLGVSEDQGADYAARTLLVLRTAPRVAGIWWYELQNYGPDPNAIDHNFGLLSADFRAKPALRAVRRVAEEITGARAVTRLPSPAHVWAIRFDGKDGRTALALWTTAKTESAVELEVALAAEAAATVDTAGGAASVPPPMPRLRTGPQQMTLRVSGTPTIVRWPAGVLAAPGLAVREAGKK